MGFCRGGNANAGTPEKHPPQKASGCHPGTPSDAFKGKLDNFLVKNDEFLSDQLFFIFFPFLLWSSQLFLH